MPTCPFCAKAVPDESSVCPHCLRGQPVVIPSGRRKEIRRRVALGGRGRLVVLVAALAAVGAYALRDRASSPGELLSFRSGPAEAPEVAPAPVQQITIAPPLDVRIADTAAVKIEAGRFLAFPFSGDGRSGCRVRGTVQVLSGGDRRASVLVVDRDGLAALESGATPRSYYESGEVHDVALDINVDGRTKYNLVVANTASGSRAKTVRLRNIVAACAD